MPCAGRAIFIFDGVCRIGDGTARTAGLPKVQVEQRQHADQNKFYRLVLALCLEDLGGLSRRHLRVFVEKGCVAWQQH